MTHSIPTAKRELPAIGKTGQKPAELPQEAVYSAGFWGDVSLNAEASVEVRRRDGRASARRSRL
ncbi:MAG: hypothetical protein LBH85_07660, partial [Treponema sp.]|nr:hypothetical protein [Treponema sp.]